MAKDDVPGPTTANQTGDLEAIPDVLPILPLRSAVLFPGGVVGLQVASPASLALADVVEGGGDHLGIFAIDRDDEEEPESLADLAPVGVVAEVVQVLRLGPDRRQLFLHGLRRIRLMALESREPHYEGRVAVADPPEDESPLETDVLIGKALAAFEGLIAVDDRYGDDVLELLGMNVDQGPGTFSDLLASHLNVGVEIKQGLVEILDPAVRLHRLTEIVEGEKAKAVVARDVQSKVRQDIDEKKREYALREQLRTIRQMLGEERGPEREAEEYAELIRELPVDEASAGALLKECDRLAILSTQSAEYPLLHNYFETVFSLPWSERTKDSLSLKKVERTLNRNHFGVSEVKERILEYLSVAKLKRELSGPVLCLVGPPGTGKTTLARSIAEAMGRKFVALSLGGVSDESEIRGHRKTYVGAMPGKIVSAYPRLGSKNPVMLLDEIDKLGSRFRGDPASALLEVLDPAQNHAFLDRYLGIPFDLSETLFVATANRLDTIPGPLRDRLEIITLSGYTEEEKVQIARRHVLPAALEDHGLERGSVKIHRDALKLVIRSYTREAGVRQLSRSLAAICRKVARRRASRRSTAATVRVRDHQVEGYLGAPIYEHEIAARGPEVGVATGLAWTGGGGELLFIEAARMPGSGQIEITGHLGDVMRESVQAAYSYVRSRAKDLEIDPERFRTVDVHIHFPAGATPKDGPSAGTAVATCLASLLSGRPVRHDVAMTGEITLRGKVLSVGGIKEKVLAAHRARIGTVLLPAGNEKDLDEIPDEVLESLRVVLAPRLEDVWREALVPILVVRKQDLDRYGEEDLAEMERST